MSTSAIAELRAEAEALLAPDREAQARRVKAQALITEAAQLEADERDARAAELRDRARALEARAVQLRDGCLPLIEKLAEAESKAHDLTEQATEAYEAAAGIDRRELGRRSSMPNGLGSFAALHDRWASSIGRLW